MLLISFNHQSSVGVSLSDSPTRPFTNFYNMAAWLWVGIWPSSRMTMMKGHHTSHTLQRTMISSMFGPLTADFLNVSTVMRIFLGWHREAHSRCLTWSLLIVLCGFQTKLWSCSWVNLGYSGDDGDLCIGMNRMLRLPRFLHLYRILLESLRDQILRST